ncbi:MAG: hypothetical protein CBB95_17870 [Alteromonas sp. TMED35]|uniref:hypothetical protein n=1 Tax=uncultured Alteromonas sp. TaxID=179113 RepID=UPI000B6272B5|nr:MAG: hypothetical protein CBB95_17870 [Alteromonas sp. TMED35]|tara:strand:- start:61692 stop:62075 length:384 start_codon:yes stop_codon:yes gene_type:complete
MYPHDEATMHDDILRAALHYYFDLQKLTPMDALPLATETIDWKRVLLSMMCSTVDETLRVGEIITADPVKDRPKFDAQFKEAQTRTLKVSSIAGMLCQAWTCDDVPPYQSDSKMIEALAFIQLKATM